MLKQIFIYSLGLASVLTLFINTFCLQSAHAQSLSMSRVVTTEQKTLSPDVCAAIKKFTPGHNTDPDACTVKITHTFVAPAALLQNLDLHTMTLKVGANPHACGPNGATASAYDDLSYSYLWKEELYTQFAFNGVGCDPTLLKNNGYVKYAIIGLTSLNQTTMSYNSGHTMLHAVENITSTNGLFGFGNQMSSCQSRSYDSYGHWPYYSNLTAQDC